MSSTKIKAGMLDGVSGDGTSGQFLKTLGDGSMSWSAVQETPVVTSISYPGSATAASTEGGDVITVTGTNLPLGGGSITVGGTAASTISWNTATQLTFVSPVKAAGDYDIVVYNSLGTGGTLVNGISYDGVPSWSTAAGSVGSFLRTNTNSVTIPLSATDPDGGAITYSLASGSLPNGFSLNTTNGNITGNIYDPGAVTTFNFTVDATDEESQVTNRAFSIELRDQIVQTFAASTTWTVPAGITSVQVELAAGGGGGGGGGSGGSCGYATGGAGGAGGLGASSSGRGGTGSTGGNYTGGTGGAGGGAVYESAQTVSVTPGNTITVTVGQGGAGGVGGYFRGGYAGGSHGGRAGSPGSPGGQSSFGSTTTSGTNSTYSNVGNAGNGSAPTATAAINDQPSNHVPYNGETGGNGADGKVRITY